jgi:hypothetical protein
MAAGWSPSIAAKNEYLFMFPNASEGKRREPYTIDLTLPTDRAKISSKNLS